MFVHADEEDEDLKRVEEKRKRLADDPAEQDEQGDDEETNLDARSDGNGHRQVELALGGDRDGGNMLGRAAGSQASQRCAKNVQCDL